MCVEKVGFSDLSGIAVVDLSTSDVFAADKIKARIRFVLTIAVLSVGYLRADVLKVLGLPEIVSFHAVVIFRDPAIVRQAAAQLPSPILASCLKKVGNVVGNSRLKVARLCVQCFEFLVQRFELCPEIFVAHGFTCGGANVTARIERPTLLFNHF